MSQSLKDRLQKLTHKADWVGLREVKETLRYSVARDGKIEKTATTFDQGAMVEVLVQGHFAYYGTQDTSLAGLQRACDRAVALAEAMSSMKLTSFSPDHRPPAVGYYGTRATQPLKEGKAGAIIDTLLSATQKMKVSDKIISCSAIAYLSDKASTFVSSSGAEVHQEFQAVMSNLQATAQEGAEIQTRSTGMPCHQGGLELLDKEGLAREAERVGREALDLLTAEECPQGYYDLLLAPDQLYLQVHESIGHPLELDRILGDERNYAGWSFVEKSDFGKLQYGSPLLNVVFDPGVQGESASYAFDDTGSPAIREYIIKEGILIRSLGGQDSQSRTGLPGVACTRASGWNRPPIDRMANLNIEPGESSLEEMIGSMERGIYMTTNRSWSIDDYRNKFQFGCEYARLIEKGKLTKVLKNPNYRGFSTPFWKSLKQVGNASTFQLWGSPFCGKGEPNQGILVGHAVPACLFEGVEVFGGAA